MSTATRVFVAMSGGVDSSTAAALLVERGYAVTGVTMRLLPQESAEEGCCSASGARAAKRVCDTLGIPHYTLEMSDCFEHEVIEPYVRDYLAGRTPNPCVACNDRVKFVELLRRAMLAGGDMLATGHYARIVEHEGRLWLARGADESKDQSYFLYRMTAEQLAATLFPLGQLTKQRVREIARAAGLPTAERPESQESCFVPDGDVRSFLRSRAPEAFSPGAIVDAEGTRLGTHDGAVGLTVGQRKGLRIAGSSEPLYVTSIDTATGTVTVGPRDARLVSRLVASDIVWSAGESPVAVQARTRYRAPGRPGVARVAAGRLEVRLDEPVESPAAGQALVCYVEDRVVGGGVLEEV